MIRAKDIMSENVIVIRPDLIVRQVAHLMMRDRVSGFPVVAQEGQVVGIITMTDLFAMINRTAIGNHVDQFYKKLPLFKTLTVAEVMSQKVITIDPETPLPEIIRILVDQNVHTFPVVESQKIIGIVSRHDILNAIFTYDP